MTASPQADPFGAPAPVTPAAKPAPTATEPKPQRHHFPTPPSMAWAKELTAAGEAGHQVTFMVSLLWTGVVVESLQIGAEKRLLLHKDGTIRAITPDPGAHGRVIFLDPEKAKALHAAKPLVPVKIARGSATYRFAVKGETADPILDLPTDYGEQS